MCPPALSSHLHSGTETRPQIIKAQYFFSPNSNTCPSRAQGSVLAPFCSDKDPWHGSAIRGNNSRVPPRKTASPTQQQSVCNVIGKHQRSARKTGRDSYKSCGIHIKPTLITICPSVTSGSPGSLESRTGRRGPRAALCPAPSPWRIAHSCLCLRLLTLPGQAAGRTQQPSPRAADPPGDTLEQALGCIFLLKLTSC